MEKKKQDESNSIILQLWALVMGLIDTLDENNGYQNIDIKHIDMIQDSMLKLALIILRNKDK